MPRTSFAQRELSKHGWKKGKGLGKLEDGLKEAIKVKVKNNKGGLGLDHGSEFSFHWWDHIFNKAANSMEVMDSEDGVEIKKSENSKQIVPTLISNSKPLPKRVAGKPLMYGTFVSAGTVVQGELSKSDESNSDISSDDEEEDLSCKDTLEKTFKMTGLTGHKAARHGFKLNGKLKRIETQELNNANFAVKKSKDNIEAPLKKNKKESKSKYAKKNNIENLTDQIGTVKKTKKKRKISSIAEESDVSQINSLKTIKKLKPLENEMNPDKELKFRKKKKKKKKQLE